MSDKIHLLQGDITQIPVEAIVNAANSSLLGGGGVDGAIHRAGGKSILAECQAIRDRQGGCKPGDAVITGAGNLPAKYVIHTVGPVWQGGEKGEAEVLRSAYHRCLDLVEEHRISAVSFPNISTGIYGFPKALAAQIAFEAISARLSEQIGQVNIVCFDTENYAIWRDLLSA
ncbi:O-acetyl-ADP-ribose deacetylase [Kalamiella sp. sgz302252]|uniref:O-acetyl-ADP-ribose deacetylase n=1 Tax=Pantoea sp. sgz302252 TaxID=3341827 RepID=UPI0036D43A13